MACLRSTGVHSESSSSPSGKKGEDRQRKKASLGGAPGNPAMMKSGLSDSKAASSVFKSNIQDLTKSAALDTGAAPRVFTKAPLRERQPKELIATTSGTTTEMMTTGNKQQQQGPLFLTDHEEEEKQVDHPIPHSDPIGRKTMTSVFEVFTLCAGITPNLSPEDEDETDWGREKYYDDLLSGADSQEEQEELQMRRLTSWSTMGSLGTATSEFSLDTIFSELKVDDDGKIIERQVLEKRRQIRGKLKPKRSRRVKFDYPPVKSLRECPRPDPKDLPELFFTEQELDIYEADRESTYMADDIEIVAVAMSGDQSLTNAKSNSSDDESKASDPPACRAGNPYIFGNYISTPRKWTKKKPSAPFAFHSGHGNNGGRGRSRTHSTTEVRSPRKGSNEQTQPAAAEGNGKAAATTANTHHPERLLKSVQIMLRERSSGR